jgi:hypothetical protein
MTDFADSADQLAAITEVAGLLRCCGVAHWLFGGWAVDFHAGRLTRPHGDIDVAVWARDGGRVARLLAERGWVHRPEAGEDGYTVYERGAVRLEVAFLARDAVGRAYTPLREGRGEWPDGAFGDEVGEVQGVRARVIGRAALLADKSVARPDPTTAAKDRQDVAALARTS